MNGRFAMGIHKNLLLLPLITILISGCDVSKKATCIPMMLDMNELQASKMSGGKSLYFKSLEDNCKLYCVEDPITVMGKSHTFGPNNHYYCSVGPYWWPDEEHPGKYINRDGLINPKSKQYDRDRLIEMTKRSQKLSKAFYLVGEKVYYDAFVRQLKAWFIDEDTYMLPNFEYAQVIPGQRENKGRSTGLIDAYYFNTLIESIRLVNSVKKIDKRTMDALQRWFLEFARWADEGGFGESLRKANNNIGLAYDVTLTNMYLFGGDEKRAKEIADGFAGRRINVQILEDGSQPAELMRTNAVSYSIFNLTHIIDFCYLVRYWYPDYYQEHSDPIDKAFGYLEKYVKEPAAFPYQQISSWDDCRKNYYLQKERVSKFKN